MFHSRSDRSLLTNLLPSIVGLVLTLHLASAPVSGQVLVGNPYITGFEGWTSTYVTAPTQVGPPPSWGVLLTPDPLSGQRFLIETSDGREADAVTTAMVADGKYKPYLLVNTADTTPANYTINYQLASADNDGFGIVFGYQDNNNYFRVGFREQAGGNLGFQEGTSVQKVVNGVITQIANTLTGFVPNSAGTPFDAKVVVAGTNWDIQVNNTSILNGSDADLKPGNYGVHSWAQRELSLTASPQYGTIVGPITVTSATLNKTTNFANAVSSIPWRRLEMIDSFGTKGIVEADDHGNFAQDFTNGTIRDDSNGFANATGGAPNTDFIGPAIVVDSPGAAAMTNYRFTTRVENRDNDGIGLLVRVADDNRFYRINWATEGPGTGTTRPPAGMSIQKYDNGIWTQVFAETTPTFLPADSVPFDVVVSAVGNTIRVDVLDDPNGAARPISYDPVVDAVSPILAGSVGLTNWGNGDGGNGAVYSAFNGSSDRFVTAITAYTDLDLTINRTTGNVTLTNNTGAPVGIKGVTTHSSSSALNAAQWNSISAVYDEPPGNGSVDPDDPWTVLESTDIELSEREQSAGGNGATLSVGETVDLGNVWRKSQIEDVSLTVELTDGSVIIGGTNYTGGPGGTSFSRSDFNVDGVVNSADWPLLYPNMLSDLSAMTRIQRALAGDVDLDGDVDVTDFVFFKTDYDAANGAGAFNAMLANVPEPSAVTLLLVAGIGVWCTRTRRKGMFPAVACAVLMLLTAVDLASADPLDFTTFTTENFPHADSNADPLTDFFPLGEWTVTPNTATHNVNAGATVLYSPQSIINKRISGTLTPNTDDDVVGFMLGFEPGDAAIGSSADYLVLDWKRVAQNFNYLDFGTEVIFHNSTPGGTMPLGMALSRATGSPTADELWQHQDLSENTTGGVTELARAATFGSTGWVNNATNSYQFDIIYTSSNVQISVDGVQQFNVNGSFPDGRFGLYTMAQGPPSTFSDFEISDIVGLSATVNRSDGTITINNPFGGAAEFDFYQFTSASGSLTTAVWNSLSDQNFQSIGPGEHQKWQEAGGSDSFELAEVFLASQSTLAGGAMQSIGAAYNNLVNGEDLQFQFRLATGELRSGAVAYIGTAPVGLMGDYNGNGTVDAADYVLWRKTLNQSVTPGSGADGDGNGIVQQNDYAVWRANFGRPGPGSGAALGGSESVPEPASLALALGIAAVFGLMRSTRNRGGLCANRKR